MKISDLIKVLERSKLELGDVEVTMQGTLLKDGLSASESKLFPDVFESTVETVMACNSGSLGKRIRLYWQV